MLGVWRNVEHLEECLNLDELKAIISASRDREHRYNKFMAALKGINIDGDENSAKEKFDEVQRRAESKLTGADQRQLELDVFGTDFEIE